MEKKVQIGFAGGQTLKVTVDEDDLDELLKRLQLERYLAHAIQRKALVEITDLVKLPQGKRMLIQPGDNLNIIMIEDVPQIATSAPGISAPHLRIGGPP